MPIFLLKSLMSLPLILLVIVAFFTMFEVFGRAEKRFETATMIRAHRINGLFYVFLFLAISYLCIAVMASVKADLPARAAFHSVFALAIAALLLIKVVIVRYYRQLYGYAKGIGVTIGVLSFLLIGVSAGYYAVVAEKAEGGSAPESRAKASSSDAVKTDGASIDRGRLLYEAKCSPCHDARSNRTLMGPGHKGILRNPSFPASGKPATPQAVIDQLRRPFRAMPSFADLSDREIGDLIAYMNTL